MMTSKIPLYIGTLFFTNALTAAIPTSDLTLRPRVDFNSTTSMASDVRTVTIPGFALKGTTNEPSASAGEFKLQWSRDHLDGDGGTLYGFPVYTNSMSWLLQRAMTAAAQHPDTDLSGQFVFSDSNLTVMLRALPAMPSDASANWPDFAAVCKILLYDMKPNYGVTTDAPVGFVLDPQGKAIMQVAVVPNFQVAISSRTPTPSLTSPASTGSSPPLPIPGTAFALTTWPGTTQASGSEMIMSLEFALDVISFTPSPSQGYSSLAFASGTMASASGEHVFQLSTRDGPRFTKSDITAITNITMQYVKNQTATVNTNPTALGDSTGIQSIRGQITDANGLVVASLQVGEPAQPVSCCDRFLTHQPGMDFAFGCMAGQSAA